MKALGYNGLALAYIGDSYYELKIREYLLEKGYSIVNDLHKMAIKFTSGEAQARFMDYFISNNILSDEEISVFKKGRNSNSNGKRKNISLATYMKATGFEALIGYLYIENKFDRLNEILNIIFELSEGE